MAFNIILIIGILLAAGAVVFALIRGLYYFAQSNDARLNGETGTELLQKQNQMMFARVKYQAITVILLVVLGMVAASQ
jgi:predicted RND superfamily exporter protein